MSNNDNKIDNLVNNEYRELYELDDYVSDIDETLK